jgi:hypothetical protein
LPIFGDRPGTCGVICRVMQQDRAKEDGVGVNAQQLAIAREGGEGDVFLTVETDPSTVERLCFGRGVPVLDERELPANRDSYTYCPVWQAERQRIEDGRRQLAGGGVEDEPEPVAHWDDGRGGVRQAPAGSSWDSADPWAQARADLDVLAPGS